MWCSVVKYLWQNIYKEYICYICIHTYVEYIFVRFAVPAWLPCSCLAHFANLWEVTSLDICLRILFYRFQGRCWKPISSWRRRFNSCWVIALDLTMLTHFTPPPASWFQSYPTLSWFLCKRKSKIKQTSLRWLLSGVKRWFVSRGGEMFWRCHLVLFFVIVKMNFGNHTYNISFCCVYLEQTQHPTTTWCWLLTPMLSHWLLLMARLSALNPLTDDDTIILGPI